MVQKERGPRRKLLAQKPKEEAENAPNLTAQKTPNLNSDVERQIVQPTQPIPNLYTIWLFRQLLGLQQQQQQQ